MAHLLRDDGARLAYELRPATGDTTSETFLFQHGMGGQRSQPLGYLDAVPDVDLVCMDARGHGDSSDIIDTARCGFDAFADDAIALADHLGLDRFIIGGISLGAAVALNLASRYPTRISALVLCRPAWADAAQDHRNRNAYGEIADLLDTVDPADALSTFVAGTTHRDVAAQSPNAAQSLRHQITRPRAAVNVEILRRFPFTAPVPSHDTIGAIGARTLIIGHHDDPFHPWAIADTLSNLIAGSTLVEVPSKDRDPTQFAAQINDALRGFLTTVQTR